MEHPSSSPQPERPTLLAYLAHIGFNFWSDHPDAETIWNLKHVSARPYLRCDDQVWADLTERLARAGFTMIVLDLGDGILYTSHPEIAVHDAWTVDRLRAELVRLRSLGLEPIPKLNFSAAHDVWLGDYARMVSTAPYYQVCRDLIREVIEIFDRPRLFHLGMDEETHGHQRTYRYSLVRQYDLWWEDFFRYVAAVEEQGVRAWVWSDYLWEHPELFLRQMPKSVLQSNWYYGAEFGEEVSYSRAYLTLAEHGYDQVPTASNWTTPLNFARTVEFCRQHIPAQHLLGFMQTVWRPTLPDCVDQHTAAIEQVEAVRAIIGTSNHTG
jgi:hypothetical protein